MSRQVNEPSEYSTYGKRNKEYESSNGNASFIRGEVNVHGKLVEGNVPVRAFVSIVRRTKRVITKLENLPALLRVRDCWRNIIEAWSKCHEKNMERSRVGRRDHLRVISSRWQS